MRVVIVGARERETDEDRRLVEELVDKIAATNFDVIFICTNSWNKGVGQFVRTKCLEKDDRSQFKYQVVIFDVRAYTSRRSPAEMADFYIARDESLFVIADALYYLAGHDRKGTAEDLVAKMQAAGRPVKILAPGEPISLIGEEAIQARA